MEILYSVLGFGGLAVLIWAVRSVKRWGAADLKKEQAERERDHANSEAKKWADADTMSTPDRLRDLARKKRRSKLLP